MYNCKIITKDYQYYYGESMDRTEDGIWIKSMWSEAFIPNPIIKKTIEVNNNNKKYCPYCGKILSGDSHD